MLNGKQDKYGFGDEFQIQVLSLCLRDPQFIVQYFDVLSYTYFDNQSHSTLAYLLFKNFQQHGNVPSKEVMGFLIVEHCSEYDRDGALGMSGNLTAWLDHLYVKRIDEDAIKVRVVRFGRRQEIKKAMIESIELLKEQSGILDEFEDDVPEKIALKIDTACRKGTSRDFGIELVETLTTLPALLQEDCGPATKIPTGWTTIDDDLMGGLGPAELGVIQALPNVGKSTSLVVLGHNASIHLMNMHVAGNPLKSVIHITCEQRQKPILRKYGACATLLDQKDVLLGTQDYMRRAAEKQVLMAPVYVKYFRPGSTSAEEIKWWIANLQMVNEIEPGMILLDYADRLKGGEDDRFRGMGQIYDQLIGMGDRFNCPFWTATQARRAGARESVLEMDSVAESWKKAEAADVIISLNRNAQEEQDKVARLFSAKVRDGESRRLVYCHYDPAKVFLTEMSEAEAVAYKAGIEEAQHEDTGGSRYAKRLREQQGGADGTPEAYVAPSAPELEYQVTTAPPPATVESANVV